MSGYIPKRGDVAWINFDPQLGSEQAGRRPALILSPYEYHQMVGLLICCPITSRVKDYPFEVVIPPGLDVHGVILSDHIKSLDWRERNPSFLCMLPEYLIEEVLGKVNSIIESEHT